MTKLISAYKEHRLIETEYPYRTLPRSFSETASGKRIIALLEQADEVEKVARRGCAIYRSFANDTASC